MNKYSTSAEELMELERESYRRNVTRDIEWMKKIHAKNALLFNPGSEVKNAHEFFSERLKSVSTEVVSENAPKFSWEPTYSEVSSSNDMGWVHGVITIEYPDGHKEFGKYVSVWIREDDEWKVTAEIRNSDS
ncbi:nuclear transport factor 2 family protein [Vibrio pacinii]|uniref:nuclear transport factor 2 family protein n=1 Tax=Vibrio pacinii TaxID=170674 RepID=UPI000570455B|nr:nuclear transport factor 2 family protein [Vibrio pacinii]